jgi:GAF domain-containing protein
MQRRRERIRRLVRGLSRVSADLRGVRDEPELFKILCRALAESGLAMAWAGPIEPASRRPQIAAIASSDTLRPANSSGLDPCPVPQARIEEVIAAAGPLVLGPGPCSLSTASGSGDDVVARALFPILADGFVVGMMGCVATDPAFFGDVEVDLLAHAVTLAASRLGALARREREHEMARALHTERDRLNRLTTAMRRIDEVAIRPDDPAAAYREICQIPIDLGLGAIAWFGTIDRIGAMWSPRIVASAGQVDYLRSAPATQRRRRSINGSSAADTESMASPRHQVVVIDDLLADARFEYRHAEASRAGVRSVAAAPVHVGAHKIGSLVVYARGVSAFGASEVAVIERLARHLGHLVRLHRSESRRRALDEQVARLLGQSPLRLESASELRRECCVEQPGRSC